MKLSLRQEARLELKQTLEMKQELVLQLKQIMENEFEEYISIEEDSDVGLLLESLPFLLLHELNHPLYTEDMLVIPELELPDSVTDDIYVREHPLYIDRVDHNAVEIGIDSGAMLLGQSSCGYDLDTMIQSNTALSERVIRDSLETRRVKVNYSLIARLDAQLRLNQERVMFWETRNRIDDLIDRIAFYIKGDIPELLDSYEGIVKAYQDVYDNTKITNRSLLKRFAAERLTNFFKYGFNTTSRGYDA